MTEMTYEEAVAYVMCVNGAAFTFIPETRGGKVVGGYGPENVPDEARSAPYLPTDPSASDALDCVLETLLLRLKGYSFKEAQNMPDRMTPEQIIRWPSKPVGIKPEISHPVTSRAMS